MSFPRRRESSMNDIKKPNKHYATIPKILYKKYLTAAYSCYFFSD
ncbi:hypothetical protein RFEPED_0975 [Rickettsia felis str. Pedreira]|uniref:Uncharacterized protein n=1 Tax=Rickettsia felis str. Pedreira TaxID=1359196 RepID=A0A0F3MS86_RICFI|nr:hypothetical protein RFEPED_0975 [Rickettsia felis str. Pedreira]